MHSLKVVMQSFLHDRDKSLCIAIDKKGLCCKLKSKQNKYCSMHLSRYYKYDSFDLPPRKIKICKFVDCDAKHFALGYCQKHYKTHKKNLRSSRLCAVEKCYKNHYSFSFCETHYRNFRKYGEPVKIRKNQAHTGWHANNRKNKFKIKACIVPDCDIKNSPKTPLSKGLCSKHYSRWYRFKDYNITSKKEYTSLIKSKLVSDKNLDQNEESQKDN